MVVLGLVLGLLVASPQIWKTLQFYPKSVRSRTTYEDKVRVGSIHPIRTLLALLNPNINDKPDGVYYPEVACYIGLIGLILAISCRNLWMWSVVVACFLLSMGRRTPLFRLCHRFCLRIPARFIYFIGVTLVLMATSSLPTIPSLRGTLLLQVACLLQAWDLLQNSRLVPMEPFTQRWQRPSQVYGSSVTTYLKAQMAKSTHRVIGLPYPNSTGQIQHIRTQGYNGGAGPMELAGILGGSETYDWKDSRMLDWYGIKYAYTYRQLTGKWKFTEVPHLYENTQVYSVAHEL